MVVILKYFLSLYRKWSVYQKPHCRFHPSCSEYALEALDKHGAAKGSYLAFLRLIRCNQLFKGGFDPVPGQ